MCCAEYQNIKNTVDYSNFFGASTVSVRGCAVFKYSHTVLYCTVHTELKMTEWKSEVPYSSSSQSSIATLKNV